MFRTCFVATNLVTSPKNSFRLPFWPTTEQFCIHSFHSFSSTSTSSATSKHGTVPESSRNKEESNRNEERTRNTRSSGPNIIQIKRTKIIPNFKLKIMIFIILILFNLMNFSIIFQYGKSFDLLVYTNVPCVGARISILISISDRLGPYIFHRSIEKTQPMREEMNGKVFLRHQSRQSIFVVNTIKVLLPNCTLTWCKNNYVSRLGKDINKTNESTLSKTFFPL